MYEHLPAFERGVAKSGEFVRGQRIEEMTVAQYRTIGYLYATAHFAREETRQRFMAGWYGWGRQFFGLFKTGM